VRKEAFPGENQMGNGKKGKSGGRRRWPITRFGTGVPAVMAKKRPPNEVEGRDLFYSNVRPQRPNTG